MKTSNRSLITWALLALAATQAASASLKFTPLLNIRWRHEYLNTLSANPALDHEYNFGSLRERFGGDLGYGVFALHALGQGGNAYHLPDNASFGAGSTYFTQSNRDTSPSQVDLAELGLIARPSKELAFNLGRQGIKEGAEPASGNARIDWIRDNRVSERLIGTWEWTNVARRFDGLTGAYNGSDWSVSGFAARILQGGFDYPNAFKPLDDVKTAGASFTAKPGAWIPNTEVRFFNVVYRDDRPVTRTALGDTLAVDAIGTNLIGVYPSGPGAFDVMLWFAYEFGDYGSKTQSSEAVIFETGYGLPERPWAPWLRGGVSYAGGGDPAGSTHHTFVNMAPTNHKFYGMQDLNALQNLTDIFAQFMVQPLKPLKVALEGHLFQLSDRSDAWYTGSGPANNTAFGITARSAAGGLDRSIGSEIDLTATATVLKRLTLQLGMSHFEGGGAAEHFFPVKSTADFLYFQTVFQF